MAAPRIDLEHRDELIRHIAEDRARERQLQRENALRRKRLAQVAAAVAASKNTPGPQASAAVGKGQHDSATRMRPGSSLASAPPASRPTTTSDAGLSAEVMSVATTATTTATNTTFSNTLGVVPHSLRPQRHDSYAAKAHQEACSSPVTRAPGGLLPPRASDKAPHLPGAAAAQQLTQSGAEFAAIERVVSQWATSVEAPSPTLPIVSGAITTAVPHVQRPSTPKSADAAALPPLRPQRPATTEAAASPSKQAQAGLAGAVNGNPSSALHRTASAPARKTRSKSSEPKSIVKRFPLKRQLNVKNVRFTDSTKGGTTDATDSNDASGGVFFAVHDGPRRDSSFAASESFASPYSASFIQRQCASAAAVASSSGGTADFGERDAAACWGGSASKPAGAPLATSPVNAAPDRRPGNAARVRGGAGNRGPVGISANGTFHTGVTMEEKSLEAALREINAKIARSATDAHRSSDCEDDEDDDDDIGPGYGNNTAAATMSRRAIAPRATPRWAPPPVLQSDAKPATAAASPAAGVSGHRSVVEILRLRAAARAAGAANSSAFPTLEADVLEGASRCSEQEQQQQQQPPPVMDLSRNPLIRRGRPKAATSLVPAGAPTPNIVLPHTAPRDDPKLLPRRDLRSGKRISHVAQ